MSNLNQIKHPKFKNELTKLLSIDSPFTNKELAESMETSESSIKRLKSGEVMDIVMIDKFASIHGKEISIR